MKIMRALGHRSKILSAISTPEATGIAMSVSTRSMAL
jgi:hypothetical protein